MEDLFGDAEQVHVPITATPPAVKGLAERLDELAGTGCCQYATSKSACSKCLDSFFPRKISWSRFGSIAAVSPDGHGVEIFNYLRDARGEWHLSQPIPAPFGPNGINVNPIVHVSWSHMGNTLAAVDSHGRISIYVTGYVQGDVSLRRQNFTLEPDDDMHTLVGFHWLPVHPQESMVSIFSHITRSLCLFLCFRLAVPTGWSSCCIGMVKFFCFVRDPVTHLWFLNFILYMSRLDEWQLNKL